jgi:hypothetical protein
VIAMLITKWQPSSFFLQFYFSVLRPSSWSSGQSVWLLIVRSRVWLPVLPWGFFLEEEDPPWRPWSG